MISFKDFRVTETIKLDVGTSKKKEDEEEEEENDDGNLNKTLMYRTSKNECIMAHRPEKKNI